MSFNIQIKAMLRHLRDVARSLRGVTVGHNVFRLPLGCVVRIDEAWMRDAIARFLPDGDGIFLDVGVNLGQTLLSLRSVDRDCRYVGFEPNAECVSFVRRIIRENGFENSTVVPAACAGEFGIARLFHYSDSAFDSAASMVPHFREAAEQRGESLIICASVEHCLNVLDVRRVGLVKIDVEGFEANVLEALEPVLRRDKPPILIEVLPIGGDSERRKSAQRIINLLQRLDFDSFQITKDAQGGLTGFKYCGNVGEQDEVTQSDYLLAPKGLERKIILST